MEKTRVKIPAAFLQGSKTEIFLTLHFPGIAEKGSEKTGNKKGGEISRLIKFVLGLFNLFASC